jgi:hypothetical protein
MVRRRFLGSLCLSLVALSSAAAAQQAPLLPRAGSGAVIHFLKTATVSERQVVIRGLVKILPDYDSYRTFDIFLEDNHIVVRPVEARVADFSLGAAKATSKEGDKGGPITPAFKLTGFRNHLLVGFNVGDSAEVKNTGGSGGGSTLLSPGATTQGVNVIWNLALGGPTSQQDLNGRAERLETVLNGGKDKKLLKNKMERVNPLSTVEFKTFTDTLLKALGSASIDTASNSEAYHLQDSTDTLAVYSRFNFANYKFTTMDAKDQPVSESGTVAALSVGVQKVFESFNVGGQSVQLGAGVGFTSRMIMGDVTTNPTVYEPLFGKNGRKVFWGFPELTLFAKAGETVPYIRITNFHGAKLQGFNNWQVTIGVDIFPTLFGASK